MTWEICKCGDCDGTRVFDFTDTTFDITDLKPEHARLIANAPELLNFVKYVLKDQLTHNENGQEHGDAVLIAWAETLISKVEGKSK